METMKVKMREQVEWSGDDFRGWFVVMEIFEKGLQNVSEAQNWRWQK